MARLIGSLEQNCLGVRGKHPLVREIMENTELRCEFHEELIQCLEGARVIGNDEGDDDSSCGCGSDEDDDNNNAQEAHEAIRPTDITVAEARQDMQPKEKRMYKLIWNQVKSHDYSICICRKRDSPVMKRRREQNYVPCFWLMY